MSDDRVLHGSCLCAGVCYEITGGVEGISHCHCSMCRKAHGAAFGTYATVRWAAFAWTSGEELVARYRSSESITRSFCKRCGANLQFIPDDRPGFGLAIGTLDDDPVQKPIEQIWTADKAPWWDLQDEPPCYDFDSP